MAPPSVWTTPGVRGLEADVDDTVVVLLGPAVVVLVVVLVGEDVLELLDEDELDDVVLSLERLVPSVEAVSPSLPQALRVRAQTRRGAAVRERIMPATLRQG